MSTKVKLGTLQNRATTRHRFFDLPVLICSGLLLGSILAPFPSLGEPQANAAVETLKLSVSGLGSTTAISRTGQFAWKRRITGATISCAYFTDINTGTAVGENGTILRTIDGGATWTVQSTGTRNALTDVTFSNANTGVATGENGTMLRTTNGGATWKILSCGGMKALRAFQPSPVELWVSRYNGPANNSDDAAGVAASPDGARVFVTGTDTGVGTFDDWATVAYDAITGKQLWVTRFNGSANRYDSPQAAPVVSPDGSRIYVIGDIGLGGVQITMRTAAYDAANGTELWAASYQGPAKMSDAPRALALSSDGSRLFVTGWSQYPSPVFQKYLTVAYDTSDGRQLWVVEYEGPGTADDAFAIAVSPNGSKVFVTGASIGSGTHVDFATVAYDTNDGSELWVARYNGPGNYQDEGQGIGVSRDGLRVFVTGESASGATVSSFDYATIAYDAIDGSQLWVRRYDGPGQEDDWPRNLAVAGNRVFVTGGSLGAESLKDFATVAYGTIDGSELWVARYHGEDKQGGFHSMAREIVVNMDGNHVFVAGLSSGIGTNLDYVTAAYRTSDGQELWLARYDGRAHADDTLAGLAVHGNQVYVTGSEGVIGAFNNDYATVAYEDQIATPTPSPPPTATPTATATPCTGTIFLTENFDELPAGTPDPCWFISNVDPDTAPHDAFTPDNDYISDCPYYLPGIDIPNATSVLRFRNRFNTEHSDGIFWDGGVLEVSSPNINGGEFLDITRPEVGASFITGGYTGVIFEPGFNPLAGRPAWTGDSKGYIDTVINLGPQLAGETITFRFRFGSDDLIGAPGWRIDTIVASDGVCPAPAPTLTPTATPTVTGTPTATASPIPAQALNISTRLWIDFGDRIMIGGFIVTPSTGPSGTSSGPSGPGPKTVAVRGIGPSLADFGISDGLADPTLELRDGSGALLLENDNWQDDPEQAAQLTALSLAPQHPNESGLVAELSPGAYTTIVAGKNNGTGVGLMEVYDTTPASTSRLANISTRGFVQTGDNVMIGGFILGGSTGNTSVAVRGMGPSLTQSGLSNVLADPTLELRDSNGALLVGNDNWQDDPASAAQFTAHGLAPQNSLESGIFTSLQPGAFTAILAGKNGGNGIGLVEIYNVQ